MLRHLQLELSVASKKKNEIVSIQSALESKLISLCLSSGYAYHVIFLLKRAFLLSQCLFPLKMINSWVLFKLSFNPIFVRHDLERRKSCRVECKILKGTYALNDTYTKMYEGNVTHFVM